MARLTRQWRSILGRQATKVIRAKAGWARLGTLASEEVLDCATTLPRSRDGQKTPSRPEGYARNSLPGMDQISIQMPFSADGSFSLRLSALQAGSNRVPINSQEAFFLSERSRERKAKGSDEKRILGSL
jgi:hypothetical protein